jgi:hypothetical protein
VKGKYNGLSAKKKNGGRFYFFQTSYRIIKTISLDKGTYGSGNGIESHPRKCEE